MGCATGEGEEAPPTPPPIPRAPEGTGLLQGQRGQRPVAGPGQEGPLGPGWLVFIVWHGATMKITFVGVVWPVRHRAGLERSPGFHAREPNREARGASVPLPGVVGPVRPQHSQAAGRGSGVLSSLLPVRRTPAKRDDFELSSGVAAIPRGRRRELPQTPAPGAAAPSAPTPPQLCTCHREGPTLTTTHAEYTAQPRSLVARGVSPGWDRRVKTRAAACEPL